MEIIQEVALAIIGFAGGVSVAAGTFALITALGIVPRLAARMGVAGHVYKLESVIVLGGTIGSLLSVYHFPMRIGDVGLVIFGIFAGIFVGCLSMALAEAVKVFSAVPENKFKLWHLSSYIYDGDGKIPRHDISKCILNASSEVDCQCPFYRNRK